MQTSPHINCNSKICFSRSWNAAPIVWTTCSILKSCMHNLQIIDQDLTLTLTQVPNLTLTKILTQTLTVAKLHTAFCKLCRLTNCIYSVLKYSERDKWAISISVRSPYCLLKTGCWKPQSINYWHTDRFTFRSDFNRSHFSLWHDNILHQLTVNGLV